MSLFALAVAFGNGVLSFAAPCTVPLLLAYLGLLSGAADPDAPEPRAGRVLQGSMVYVAGLGVVFAALGVVAGSTGRAIDLQDGQARRVGGGVVLAAAALLLAGTRAGWPARIGRRWPNTRAGSGSLLAPFWLGVLSGAVFTPCVGPLLAVALALAASAADAVRGGILLLAFALGLGVPFVLAAMGLSGSERLRRRIPRGAGAFSYLAAGLLGVLGLLLLTGRYDVPAGWLARLVLVAST